MSNYTKSFNFRNGVQVDDDNFVISPSGLVGIGTTQPSKSLDVFGDTRVSGISSLNHVDVVGVLTVGSNITIDATTGIISATSFSGNISGAGGVVAIATAGWVQNVGALTTDAKVGIKTDDPEFDFQVGSNPKSGVGIGVTNGDIFISGLTTTRNLFVSGVTTFKGGVDGLDLISVTGIASLANLTVSGVSTFNNPIDLNSNLDVSGFSTFTKFVDVNDGLDVTGHTELDNVNVSGISTFAGAIDANGNLDVDGHTELDDVNVSGVSTFAQNIFVGSGATVGLGATVFFSDDAKIKFGDSGDLEIYHGNSPYNPSSPDQHSYIRDNGTGDLVLLSNQVVIRNAAETEDMARFYEDGSVELYHNHEKRFQTIGLGASVYGQLNVASLNGGTSSLSTHFGSLTYGNESGGRPYSTRRSLDLINEDSGNINFYLNSNNIGIDTGNFHWHKGFNDSQLMTLLNTGNLGIGETQPVEKLHVSGGATITDNAFFSSNVHIDGNLDVEGNLNSLFVGDLTGDVTGNLNGNVNSTTGISTFGGSVIFSGLTTFTSNLAVGNFVGTQPFSVNTFSANRFFVAASGNVGVKTTETFGNDFLVSGSAVSNIVGIGTTIPLSAVDFGAAGHNITSGAYANRMYMIPPKITTAQRNLLVGGVSGVSTETGALIFNTSLNKLQVYNGNGWETITSS
tara:strand:+ start:250 stop:2295 length:2046 start_codon:yes stop_codon:yes gene_type:complete